MSELAILVPVLNRPANVEPLVRSILDNTPDVPRIFFICDRGDEEEIAEVERMVGRLDYIETGGAGYARKINIGIACNPDFDLYFLGADDLRFHPGWLEAAKAKLTDGIGVVGTNDLGNERVKRGEHATHSLVTRAYAELGTIDGPPGLLHEGYHHWKVDDELVATAKHRGAWAFAKDSVVEHLHPYWGKAETDAVYAKGEAHRRKDIRIFNRRRALWT